MKRSAFVPVLLAALLFSACATAPPFLRLVDVEPRIGTDIDPDSTIRVRAAYRLPSGDRYQAQLMFLTENGAMVSALRTPPVWLEEREGEVELRAKPGTARSALKQPLTALVMIMRPPRELNDISGTAAEDSLPAEVQARLDQLRDSASAGSDSVRVRSVVVGGIMPVVLRSRAIFYNGPGPAPGRIGPPLSFDEVLAEYATYGGEKAFALAVEENGQRAWGYSFGFRAADLAIARALRECEQNARQRSMTAACRVHAVGDSIVAR